MLYHHLYIVGNHEFDDKSSALFQNSGELFLGKVDFDPQVREFNLHNRSLWELQETSPARNSVKNLLNKAGLID